MVACPTAAMCDTGAASQLGIAYQTWNKPLGIWQTPEQLDYDLAQMAAMGVRSLRVEFVWSMIEPQKDVYDFTNADLLVEKAARYGMKLLPIIGFQWPPEWIEKERLLGFMPQEASPKHQAGFGGEYSSIMNYADPYVRERLAKVIRKIVERYRGKPVITAWVLGNEFTYVEYVSMRQLGYDPASMRYFSEYLKKKYRGQIGLLNRAWGTRLSDFSKVHAGLVRIDTEMDLARPAIRDFMDFRRRAMAQTIGEACVAAKEADPGAKRTYSSIGVLYSQFDRWNTSEDYRLIAHECESRGAPLSFYSVNSYLNLNSAGSFHLGLSYEMAKALTGLEVIFTEFGLTSTEEYAKIGEERQAKFLRAQYLETIVDQVPSAHVFTWTDKRNVSLREKGFGVQSLYRNAKPAAGELREVASRLKGLDVPALQQALVPPEKTVAFLLPDPDEGFLRWNSWLNENWIVASYFRQYDVPVRFLRPEDLESDDRTRDIAVLVLCRQSMLGLKYLKKIEERMKKRAFHVVAVSDAPGWERRSEGESEWKRLVRELWGVSVEAVETSTHYQHDFSVPLYYWEKTGETDRPAVTAMRTWQRSYVMPRADRTESVNWLGDDIGPIVTRKSFDGLGDKKGLMVTPAVGYVMEESSDQQRIAAEKLAQVHGFAMMPEIRDETFRFWSEVFARVAERELGLARMFQTPMTPVMPRSLPQSRVRRLRNGGSLVFLAAIPGFAMNDSMADHCKGPEQEFVVSGLEPKDELISLVGGKTVKADEQGVLRHRMPPCESDLFLSRSEGRRYLRKDATSGTPLPVTGVSKSRRELFPEKVLFFSDVARGCWYQRFARLGYREQAGVEPWQESFTKTIVASVNGDTDWWDREFGVLVFPEGTEFGAKELARIERFLSQDGDRRVVLAMSGTLSRLKTRLGYWKYRRQLAVVSSDCSGDDEELRRFLYQ